MSCSTMTVLGLREPYQYDQGLGRVSYHCPGRSMLTSEMSPVSSQLDHHSSDPPTTEVAFYLISQTLPKSLSPTPAHPSSANPFFILLTGGPSKPHIRSITLDNLMPQRSSHCILPTTPMAFDLSPHFTFLPHILPSCHTPTSNCEHKYPSNDPQ